MSWFGRANAYFKPCRYAYGLLLKFILLILFGLGFA